MNKAYIDFNTNYYINDYNYENEIYNSKIQRLAIDKVISINYENNYLKVTYKNTAYKNGINTISIDTKYISKLDIN